MLRRVTLRSILSALLLTVGAVPPAWAGIEAALENPGDGQFVSGVRLISGWAFAVSDDPANPGARPVTIRLFIDDEDYGEIPCCVNRRDIQEAHGAQALRSGFGQVFNFGRLSGIGEGEEERAQQDLAQGQHTVRLEISAEGVEPVTIVHPVTVVRPAGYEFLEMPNLLGATGLEIDVDAQEIMIQNVAFRDKNSDRIASGELWLAWQDNIQQLVVVGARTVSTGEEMPPSEEMSTSEENTEETETTDRGDTRDENDEGILAAFENPPPLGPPGERVVSQITAGGIGLVSGWAFARDPGAAIARVSLRVDGVVWEDIPCCADRPDVREHFREEFPDLPNVGFGGLINMNRIPSGARTLGVEIQRDTADPTETWVSDHEVSVVRLGDAEFLDDFRLTEESGALVNGRLLTLQDVEIRARGNPDPMTIDAGFFWSESCQCFLPWPLCGNGGRDVREECDGTAFSGLTCQTLGFGAGDLSCQRDEENAVEFCVLDTSDCETDRGAAAYVTLVNEDAVAVISTSTNEVASRIPVGDRPRGIAISPDGTAAYVTNTGDNTVSVIETATRMVVATIPVGRAPQGIAFAPDGATAYVTNARDQTVSVIDTATQTPTTTIAVGRSPQAIAVAVTPHGPRAYVPNFEDDTVTVIDLTTQTPLPDPILVGEGPLGVVATPDGTRVYVTNFGATNTSEGDGNGDTVSLIDTATNTTVMDTDPDQVGVQPLQVGVQPAGVAVIPATALELVRREVRADAFVANFLDATVSVITEEDIDPEIVTPSFGVAFNPRFNAVNNEPYGIAITPNGMRGYVTLSGARTDVGEIVQVFSTLAQRVIATIDMGQGSKPFAIAVGPQ